MTPKRIMSDAEEAVKREYDCRGKKMDDSLWSAKKPADFEKLSKEKRLEEVNYQRGTHRIPTRNSQEPSDAPK